MTRALLGCALALLGCVPAYGRDPVVGVLDLRYVDRPADAPIKCGAVAVAPDVLLTAAHCTGDVESQVVLLPHEYAERAPGGYLTGRVIARDVVRDLAAVIVAGGHFVPVAVRAPEQDELVHVVAPRADWAAAYGAVWIAGGPFAETNLTIVRGYSGSPVFGADGAVVGLISSCHVSAGAAQCRPGNARIAVPAGPLP